MNTPDPAALRASRRKLLLIMLVFAAPIVAAMLAGGLARPDPAAAKAAVAALAQRAGDGKTVSNERGYGVVGASFRIDPDSFR